MRKGCEVKEGRRGAKNAIRCMYLYDMKVVHHQTQSQNE